MKIWLGIVLLLVAVAALVAFTAEPAHPMHGPPDWTPATGAPAVPTEVP